MHVVGTCWFAAGGTRPVWRSKLNWPHWMLIIGSLIKSRRKSHYQHFLPRASTRFVLLGSGRTCWLVAKFARPTMRINELKYFLNIFVFLALLNFWTNLTLWLEEPEADCEWSCHMMPAFIPETNFHSTNLRNSSISVNNIDNGCESWRWYMTMYSISMALYLGMFSWGEW